MLNIKSKYNHFIGTFLMVLFMVPILISALHSLSDHHHEICFSKKEQHFHQKDLDCTLHLIKNSNSLLTNNSFYSYNIKLQEVTKEKQKSFLKSHQQLSFSLRAPPANILI